MKRACLVLIIFLLDTGVLWGACSDTGNKLIKQKKVQAGMAELQKCADKNDPLSMALLGAIYSNGEFGTNADQDKGFAYHKKAADLGNPLGQFLTGKSLWNGRGVKQDKTAGLALMTKAADQGNIEACYYVGFVHMNGQDGMPVNDYLALKYFGMADAAGNLDATVFLGTLVQQGRGVPKNEDLALKYFLKAAKKGNTGGQCMAADIFINKEDYKNAFPLLLQAANAGDLIAQHAIGFFFWNGAGTQMNKSEAIKWWKQCASKGHQECNAALNTAMAELGPAEIRKLAEQGNVDAQFALGVMCDTGQGVPQDYKQAFIWYKKAAGQGHATAQFNLGVMYDTGKGVARNDKEAVIWYKKASDQGNANAQFNLGLRYYNGNGVPQDYKQAVALYKKAAEQGVANAQASLGAMYGTGQGVPQNDVSAYAWASLAAAQGDANGVNNRDIAAQGLTPEQRIKAQALASEFQTKIDKQKN